MKSLFIFLIILLLTLNATAQQNKGWSLDIEGTGLLTNFTGKDAVKSSYYSSYSNSQAGNLYKLGYAVGFGVRKNFSNTIAILVNTVFCENGAKVHSYSGTDFLGFQGAGTTKFNLYYLKFPVNLVIQPLSHKRSFFIFSGLYYARLLRAEELSHLTGYDIINRNNVKTGQIDEKRRINYSNNDFGFQVGAGFLLINNGNKRLYLKAGYSRSLFSIGRKLAPNSKAFYNQSFSVGLIGYLHI